MGNVTTVSFVVDRGPPVVNLAPSSGAGILSASTVTFAVHVSDALTVSTTVVTLQWRVDGLMDQVVVPTLPLVSPGQPLPSTTQQSGVVEVAVGRDGEYWFEAQARDGAGNPSALASVTLVIDRSPPLVALGGPDSSGLPDAVGPLRLVREPTTPVAVNVYDANVEGCILSGSTFTVRGSPTLPVFSLVPSGLVDTGRAFTGRAALLDTQGNLTIIISTVDPAVPPNRASVLTTWLVRDSLAPVHTVAIAPVADPSTLDPDPSMNVCHTRASLTSCRTALGAVFAVACNSSASGTGSGGVSATQEDALEAPCHIAWALTLVSNTTSCGAASGRSTSGPDVALWSHLAVDSILLNASVQVALTLSTSALTLAKFQLLTQAVDAAGRGSGGASCGATVAVDGLLRCAL